jgi:hypothetical protein
VAIRCGFPRRELNTFGAVEATRKMECGPVAHSRNKMFGNDDRLILVVFEPWTQQSVDPNNVPTAMNSPLRPLRDFCA